MAKGAVTRVQWNTSRIACATRTRPRETGEAFQQVRKQRLAQGVRRIDDLANGNVKGRTEEEFYWSLT